MEPIKNIIKDIDSNDNGKTASIISYFTIIGWLIAYFGFHQSKKTDLGSFQLRQTLLLHIVYMIVRYGLSFILATIWLSTGIFSLYYLLRLVELVFFVLWIIGLLGAINGEKKPIPLLSEQAQIMFSSI